MLTANLFKLPDAADVIKAAQAANKAKGVALIGDRLLAPPADQLRRRPPRRAAHARRSRSGCSRAATCSAPCASRVTARTARAQPMDGAPPGTMMAPPLAGSPRVQAHRDYVIKVLLKGLTGPLDGKTYREVMVPMGGTRRVGRRDRVVRPQQLRQQRRHGDAGRRRARPRRDGRHARRRGPLPELEASLPRPLDAQQWKLTASHGAEAAAGAVDAARLELRRAAGGGHVVPVELPQPAVVTELQFDSRQHGRRSRRAAAAPRLARRIRRRGATGAGRRLSRAATSRAGVDRRHDVEQAGRRRQGRRRAHDDHVRADARKVRPDHADRHRGGRAGVVDQEPARLRGRSRACDEMSGQA